MKSKVIIVVSAIAVLIAAFVALKPQGTEKKPEENQQAISTVDQPAPPPASPGVNVFELVIKGRKIVAGQPVIQVKQGDQITIRVTSDEAEEFHIHGYDKSLELVPNVQAELTYKADVSGRFAFELEHSQIELGAIEVAPR